MRGLIQSIHEKKALKLDQLNNGLGEYASDVDTMIYKNSSTGK